MQETMLRRQCSSGSSIKMDDVQLYIRMDNGASQRGQSTAGRRQWFTLRRMRTERIMGAARLGEAPPATAASAAGTGAAGGRMDDDRQLDSFRLTALCRLPALPKPLTGRLCRGADADVDVSKCWAACRKAGGTLLPGRQPRK